MDFSTDDKHRATLAVLAEALAYLERLPPVPVTKEFCAKLRQHLNEPTARLVAKGKRELHGIGPWTPVGLPLLEVSVIEDVATVRVPQQLGPEQRAYVANELMDRLSAAGLSVGLTPRNFVPPD